MYTSPHSLLPPFTYLLYRPSLTTRTTLTNAEIRWWADCSTIALAFLTDQKIGPRYLLSMARCMTSTNPASELTFLFRFRWRLCQWRLPLPSVSVRD